MYGPAASLLAGALALFPNDRPAATPPDSATRLVVLIVVDQFRPDELLRYRAEWTGGFKRILDQGVVYTHGQQDHAITQTAPGHSTLLSGRFPAHTGIVTNELGVPDSLAPVIGDPTMVGASPRRFQGTTLGDWMLAHDSSTRLLSVSRKDRGAILPIGQSKEQVYWWADRGFFSTSRYYRDSLPSWVAEWNARNPVGRLAGRSWDLLRPATAYTEPDSLPNEKGPDGRATFPHVLPADPEVADSLMIHFPWMDSLTIDLALTGVATLGLGTREGHVDLLSVSLSTVDEVGHDYGPDSREMHDMLLRLDGYLGWFLDSLAATVPAANTVFVLAADHGVQPIPEQAPGAPATADVRVTPRAIVREVARTLRERWRTDFGVRFDYGIVTADIAALRARGVDTDSLSRALARRLSAEPYVDRVYTPRSLAVAPLADPLAARWRHTIPPVFGWLAAVTPHQGIYWGTWAVGADHGTPWPMDVGIPIVFWGSGIVPRTVTRPVRSVDIAPTLARRLGIQATERVDGVVLPEVIRATQ
jgi:arylsulfatase A-like enzyme